jgi:hypothetical protein
MTAEVEDATKAVERASGIPVVVQPDPTLKLIARVVIARGPAPAHVVLFNPGYGEATDYHIVFQCGFVLRAYLTPPALRFDIGSTEPGSQEADRLVSDHLRRTKVNLPDAVRGQLRDQLYDGLLLQLRSVPVGMRVDAWIGETYPALAAQQKASALRQLGENQAALSPKIKAIAPDKIYRASVGMNAALAAFWGRALGDPTQTVPYKVAGHSGTGERLLAVADGQPTEPAADRALVEAWGTELGISDWFGFVPFGGR